MTLVDSNVLIDVFTSDTRWYDWSASHLDIASLSGPLLINDIVYAEASVRFLDVGAFEAALAAIGIAIAPMPRNALFLAGKAYADYRRAGGIRTGVLSDFFIGAHSAVAGLPLLTRDPLRYRRYFPTIRLAAPDED
jgi:predicted nucleic acid-binding protein